MFGELIAPNRSPPSQPQVNPSAPKFPRFLLPSLPFPLRRRRDSSTPHTPGAGSTFSSASCPIKTKDRLTRTSPSLIRCLSCRSHLAFHSQIVSKGFHGRHGKALLVAPPCTSSHDNNDHEKSSHTPHAGLSNIRLGSTEKRQLATGPHEVADIFCAICETKLGWKYVKADEPSQKYKVGKFILEVVRVAVEQGLEFEPLVNLKTGEGKKIARVDKGRDEFAEAVAFDSDDEEECEELFSGIWNAKDVAARRRMDVRLGREHKLA
ncbi:yippee zinc-binding/DNA-binding /Mis18, centromere assembly-domain-containing protein [Triangularia setosa]|uniref:Yippee zinc-binding/DNA-binding /Mis18, centromere assembly-domain-containing protein n=1 Tax=Triangularia setosa TaxID=2587417 RepID=A0AAN7A5J8_9PEZI|nr:yippee zinc-binding/DNA-binding /Mis18, centromere assembly-domain-containing protein [Podospora setosa]